MIGATLIFSSTTMKRHWDFFWQTTKVRRQSLSVSDLSDSSKSP